MTPATRGERRESLPRGLSKTSPAGERLRTVCELAKSALLSYEVADPAEKRDLVTELISNGTVNVKHVVAELSKRYKVIADWLSLALGDPQREDSRTRSGE
jgi:hypothetical protein